MSKGMFEPPAPPPCIEVPPEMEEEARRIHEGTEVTVVVNPRLHPKAWRFWGKPESCVLP